MTFVHQRNKNKRTSQKNFINAHLNEMKKKTQIKTKRGSYSVCCCCTTKMTHTQNRKENKFIISTPRESVIFCSFLIFLTDTLFVFIHGRRIEKNPFALHANWFDLLMRFSPEKRENIFDFSCRAYSSSNHFMVPFGIIYNLLFPPTSKWIFFRLMLVASL